MKELSNHPVWDVYDEFRTSRLNVKYHAALLRKYKRVNFWLELILAIAAPTSAVAGLLFWETDLGAILWRFFGAVAAIVAVAKPLLGVSDKIAKLEEILVGYKSLSHDVQFLTIMIKQEQRYDRAMQQRFYELLDKKKELLTSSKIETDNKRLLSLCEQEVLKELPVESFYIPEE
jgi:hypothetical protein